MGNWSGRRGSKRNWPNMRKRQSGSTSGGCFRTTKQLQFFDLLALYFNRIHPSERGDVTFEHVPRNANEDAAVTIRPVEPGVYALSPYPFGAKSAEFSFAGRHIVPGQQGAGPWSRVLTATATVWEHFRLMAA